MLRVGTLNTSPGKKMHEIIKIQLLMIINHIFMVSGGQKLGLCPMLGLANMSWSWFTWGPNHLGDVYTMDHKVIPRPCKICDWLLNSSWEHFGLHQGKNVKVTMEFKVPKRHLLGPTLSTDIVQRVLRWEKQKR